MEREGDGEMSEAVKDGEPDLRELSYMEEFRFPPRINIDLIRNLAMSAASQGDWHRVLWLTSRIDETHVREDLRAVGTREDLIALARTRISAVAGLRRSSC
jgi:hypothetical protein